MAKASPVAPQLLRPKAIQDGDLIAIVACSSARESAKDFDTARQLIRSLRCRVTFGLHATQVHEIFAGTDEQRTEDLHTAVRDPKVKGIILLRGGYGLQRILDRIDFDLLRKHPKMICGYSDVTPLLNAIEQKSRLVCFHGPVASSSPSFFSETWFRRAVGNPGPMQLLGSPSGKNYVRHTIVPGVAEGRLTGGNLTMLSTTLGTPYEVDTRGAILFLEDIGEAPYRIDRMMTQLLLAGKLSDCRGVVVGQFTDCEDKEKSGFTWQKAVNSALVKAGKPAASGFAIEHVREKLTIPLGVRARLNATTCELEILEPAVTE